MRSFPTCRRRPSGAPPSCPAATPPASPSSTGETVRLHPEVNSNGDFSMTSKKCIKPSTQNDNSDSWTRWRSARHVWLMLFNFHCPHKKILYHTFVRRIILDCSHSPCERTDERNVSPASSTRSPGSRSRSPVVFPPKCVEIIRVLERRLHNARARRVIRESAVAARACSISHRRALYIEVRLPLTHAIIT